MHKQLLYLQRTLHSDPSPHVVRQLKADSERNTKWQLSWRSLAQLQALNLNCWACFGSHDECGIVLQSEGVR